MPEVERPWVKMEQQQQGKWDGGLVDDSHRDARRVTRISGCRPYLPLPGKNVSWPPVLGVNDVGFEDLARLPHD